MTTRFVIADDNALFRRTLCCILKALDLVYEFAGEAKNGKDAITVVDRCAPDLLILDLHMPELDGFGVMQQIRDKYPKLKILVLTLDDSQWTKEKALKCGADAFCSKSCGKADLLQSLERLVAGQAETPAC